MKKDNNALKRLLKYTNVRDLHGYFKQGDNYILCNGISVIKFDSNNIDFLDDIEPSQSIHYSYDKFNNMFNDIKKAIQDNNNTIKIDIQDLKMWKKHADKNKPFIFKIDNKYAGVNVTHLLDLALLTRQDKNNAVTIQANNNKTPLYIAGNDVSAVLCLIGLKQDYNENDYNSFIDSLADCYTKEKTIQEEKHAKKAAKSTKTIEKETLYNGFTLYFAGRQLFILSDKKRVTNDITNDFLKIMTDITGIDYINKITEIDYKYYKSGVQAATITKTTSYSGNEEIYRIETKYNSENFYKNEYDRLIIYNGNMDKIDICADDMSATDEETPKTATIQDNAANIVADSETTNETNAANVMSANNTDTTATTDTNNRKKVLHGFYMTFKNRDIFVATNEDTKRRYIVQAFINEMINISNHLQNITEEKRNNILNDEDVLNETKKRITLATIEEIWTRQENHIRITTNNGNTIINQSLNDFKTIMLDCYSANEGITPAQEKSLKFFSGISRLNNQLTETITQDIKADLQADNRQTETTQDTIQTETTQDKPHKASVPAVSLFVVTDKPQPVKLPHLKPLNNIPMYVERFKTDLQPLKSHRVYNNRVSNKKPLKKAYNDFVGTVSCYNDKCAIGGKVAAGNTS